MSAIRVGRKSQPWLHSRGFDLAFILGPPFFATAAVLIVQPWFPQLSSVPPWLWVLLIVGVDVSHVYSTLFRTYFDREEFSARGSLYLVVPLLAWIAGVILYSISSELFWRVIAYLAVFHFVRQQYGFMMMYSRQDGPVSRWSRRLDKVAIYSATLYPLVYWHCHEREFAWFIAGDFLRFDMTWPATVLGYVYVVILAVYAAREFLVCRAGRGVNWPRNLLLFGTAISWYVGIVALNNDLAFTATNVIAHGVPYMALIWLYGYNRQRQANQAPYIWTPLTRLFRWRAVPFFCGGLFVVAYLEEVLWDGLVWREHGAVLWLSGSLPAVEGSGVLTWLVPLLALPQVTHYLLDAFIWRLREPGTVWKDVLFLRDANFRRAAA